jgi:hypothetical protein
LFNSTVLDVIIGLIFGFLTVSVVTSAIVEAISSALKWRAKTFLAGIQNLVNDKDFNALALQLYQHASINPLGPGIAKTAAITDEEDEIDANENAEEAKAAKKSRSNTATVLHRSNAVRKRVIRCNRIIICKYEPCSRAKQNGNIASGD